MAEAILSPLVELLFQNLTSQATNVIQLVKGADEEIEKLRRTLGRIQALLTDAEGREVTEETVRLWIKDLRDVAYDAEDILDTFETKSLLLHSYKDDRDHVQEEARHSSPQEQQVCCYVSSPCRSFKQAKLRYSTCLEELATPMPCLEELQIAYCPKLSSSLADLPSLRSLEIRRTHNAILGSIVGLTSVAKLIIEDFEEVEFLPMDMLQNHSVLQILKIKIFPKLRYLTPELLANLISLESLKIVECDALTSLSSLKMGGLTCLKKIKIYGCRNLTALPDDLPHLPNLKHLSIWDCGALTSLFSVTTIRGCFPSLQQLWVRNCKELTCLWAANLPKARGLSSEQEKEEDVELQSLPNLMELSIRRCEKMSELPEWLGNCRRLNGLLILECDTLRSLPKSLNAPPLEYLYIKRCKELGSLPDSLKKPPLEYLDIDACPMLE